VKDKKKIVRELAWLKMIFKTKLSLVVRCRNFITLTQSFLQYWL